MTTAQRPGPSFERSAALAATPTSGRRIAVLGEMLELGASARALHADCGRAAASAHVDELVVVGGPAADGLAEGAEAAGVPRRSSRSRGGETLF